MPKTHANLWPRITAWDNLHAAYLEARKGKRYTPSALRYADRLEENLHNLQNHLMWKTWRPSPFREFVVHEPKLRLIQAPSFPDRVAHHALHRVIEPLFDRKFAHHSFACRKGKGNIPAALHFRSMLRRAQGKWGKVFAIKADISKYFPSIHHDTLLAMLPRTIRDTDALWMCEAIVRGSGYESRGIPIGALTSQLFAGIYPSRFDHFLKDDMGVEFCIRYMDDLIVLGRTRRDMEDLLSVITEYLGDTLLLTLNPKTRILDCGQGVDFCGYRHFYTHMLPRKKNVQRARKRFARLSRLYAMGLATLERVRAVVMSFLGYMKHCNGYRSTVSALRRLLLVRNGERYA